jgi:hypothetical protein
VSHTTAKQLEIHRFIKWHSFYLIFLTKFPEGYSLMPANLALKTKYGKTGYGVFNLVSNNPFFI